MGITFSSLSGFLRRSRDAFGVFDFFSLSNHPCDGDSRQDENKYDIQIEDRPTGDDTERHRNQGANCAERASIESSKACTENIHIFNVDKVVVGDNTTINFAESEQKNITVVYLPLRPEEGNSVDEETQLNTRPTETSYIIKPDSNIGILAIGSLVLNLQNGDQMFIGDRAVHPDLEEALSFDLSIQKSLRVQLLPSPLQLPSAGVEPRLVKVFDVMCTIVNQLYPLRDRGEWPEFEEALLTLQAEYDNLPEIKCLLLLEESVTLTYQKSLKAAKAKAEQCLNIVNNEASKISGASKDVLIVLGNIASASIIRRLSNMKLGKAFKCLEEAEQSGERLRNVNSTMPKFALALLDYERARCYMAFATMTNNTTHCNREACKMLGRCIDRCRKLTSESHLYTARDSFALLYLARMSLPSTSNCHSQPGQSEKLKKRSAREAEKRLQEYVRGHPDLESSPVAARVKYLITRSELSFLKGNYASARGSACEALDIAVKYGFELETVPAQTHLDQISRHDRASMTRLHDKLALPSGYSSSTTTDSDQRAT